MPTTITNTNFFQELNQPSTASNSQHFVGGLFKSAATSSSESAKKLFYNYKVDPDSREVLILKHSNPVKNPETANPAILLCLFTKQLRKVILEDYLDTTKKPKLAENLINLKECDLLKQIYENGNQQTKINVDHLKTALDQIIKHLQNKKQYEYTEPKNINRFKLIQELVLPYQLCDVPMLEGDRKEDWKQTYQGVLQQFIQELVVDIEHTICSIRSNDEHEIKEAVKDYYRKSLLESPLISLLESCSMSDPSFTHPVSKFRDAIEAQIEEIFSDLNARPLVNVRRVAKQETNKEYPIDKSHQSSPANDGHNLPKSTVGVASKEVDTPKSTVGVASKEVDPPLKAEPDVQVSPCLLGNQTDVSGDKRKSSHQGSPKSMLGRLHQLFQQPHSDETRHLRDIELRPLPSSQSPEDNEPSSTLRKETELQALVSQKDDASNTSTSSRDRVCHRPGRIAMKSVQHNRNRGISVPSHADTSHQAIPPNNSPLPSSTLREEKELQALVSQEDDASNTSTSSRDRVCHRPGRIAMKSMQHNRNRDIPAGESDYDSHSD